ncbi:unnamed protein product [Ectocarpus sp. 6 AP-2014]
MAAVEQPTSTTYAPSSDADEGLPRPESRSSSTKSPRLNGADAVRRDSTTLPEIQMAPPVDGGETGLLSQRNLEQVPRAMKELAPLVAMPPPSDAAVHSRLAKHRYSRLGRNLLFEARPAVVHFGGYVLGRAHSQCVRVVNISRTSQRLHILGPATDNFKMRCNKKGLVAPGSSEVITVDFHPREHRYHYDCLRLHTDSENLLVPLHAYPVMNDVIFPERLDFGVHALGETVRRVVKMVCKVPIQFEFEIEVTKSHPHFKIDPLRGMVPANGAVEVHIEHTPVSASSGEMHLLVSVSQFNFTPIVCVVTGAGRPGVVREAALDATASNLAEDNALQDSLGPCRSSRARAQARRLRGERDREGQHHRQQHRRGRDAGSKRSSNTGKTRGHGAGYGGGSGTAAADGGEDGEGFQAARRARGAGVRRGTGTGVSAAEEGLEARRAEAGDAEDGYGLDGGVDDRYLATAGEGADLVDTWGMRPASAEHHPYGTGKGSGAVFDAGGEWLAAEKRGEMRRPVEPWVPPTEGSVFGSTVKGPTKTTVVEGLVIPSRLDTVQATNFVLTQQARDYPGKLKPKDLKEAIRRTRAERQRQLQEQEALRSLTLTASTEPDHDDGNGGSGDRSGRGDPSHPGGRQIADTPEGERGLQQERLQQPAQLGGRAICAYLATVVDGKSGAATRQLTEMSFLQDLADTESEERDRSFKASVEHVGEPLLSQREVERVLEEQRRGEQELLRRRREKERESLQTCLKGPSEVGERCARASLLFTAEGTQGVGFRHKPDWDLYKNDDWGRRREVLRRLVNLVGAWIIRRRAGRRLGAIQARDCSIGFARLSGLRDRAQVAEMVERDNHEAKLSAGPLAGISQESWKPIADGGSSANENNDYGGDDGGWEFPDLLVTSEALAAEMLAESSAGRTTIGTSSSGTHGSGGGEGGDGQYTRHSAAPPPPPPEFQLSAEDVDQYRFPIYNEGAALSRREEVVDPVGPPSDFVDIDLLPLKEPEEGRSMGYVNVNPPGLGTYPSIETSHPLRWSAFEECGVRQPRDEEAEERGDGESDLSTEFGRKASSNGVRSASGWRQGLSTTERRPSKATLGRRRSSVGLRMIPDTADNVEEAWLQAAEAELTALAAEAEKVDRMPDSLLLRPPPPDGVDLITPDPRYKGFLPELPIDEASPEWCLRPQEIPREVPVTKGLLLGYSPGTTTLRAYANAPRLSSFWKPKRERRSSGLACMSGQASRGVWRPARAPPPPPPPPNWRGDEGNGVRGTRVVGGVGSVLNRASPGDEAPPVRRRGGDNTFRLAADHAKVAAAAGDELSDSESEDEEDDAPMPTPADARTVFDDTVAGRVGETGWSLSGSSYTDPPLNSDGDSAACVKREGRLGGDAGGGKVFARDRATAALEDARRTKRLKDAERLADRMVAIGAEVRNVKHAFVLQTPFHQIRPTEPERT